MPPPLSLDLRRRMVHACAAGELSQPEIAELFQVHQKTVEKYWHLHRHGQPLAPKPHGGGPLPRLAGHEDELRTLVADEPDATLAELSAQLEASTGLFASTSLLSRT
jgi:transposase